MDKIHRMNLNEEPFERIKSGQKTIELRLYDEKRRKIKIGDKIVFQNRASGEVLEARVLKLHRFETFDSLYQSLPLVKCGYDEKSVSEAKPEDMLKYYTLDEQKRLGVVGIELSLQK